MATSSPLEERVIFPRLPLKMNFLGGGYNLSKRLELGLTSVKSDFLMT